MKVALCYPRTEDQARSYSIMPLGAVSLATYLKQKSNHEVRVFDTSFGFKEEIKKIDEFNPDVIGLTVLLPFIDAAKEMSVYFKKRGKIIVWGGPVPTNTPKDCLEHCDFAVIGEGELTLFDLLDNLEKPSKVKGIAYGDKGKFKLNSVRDFIDINELPIPDRDLLSTRDNYLKAKNMSLIVSRGCPYNCSFCQPTLNRLFGKGVRLRSPESIVEEIQLLNKKYGTNHIAFLDDTFTFNKDWLKKLSYLFKKNKIKIGFDVLTRVNCFDDEIAILLKEMKCKQVNFGVESGSQMILDKLRKGQTVEQIKNAFKIAKKYKLSTHAYIMIGSPGETKETLKETEELMKEINPDTVNISITTPLPGTDMYDECFENGLLNFKSDKQADFYDYEFDELPIKNENLTYKEVVESKQRMLRRRRVGFIFYNLKREVKGQFKNPSISRLFYLAKEFFNTESKG
ncbi:MAG: B12-binding domain-containing radical SAM protein [Nanoarchaeota archaeon]|nr:B12-binding domain-containing radical SAM protein [Nanoarchaeota archaeon]